MIYLDHNATTPVVPEARDAMLEAVEECWGNPSSGHRRGRQAKRLLDASRATVAEAVGAEPEQVVFTSGATEAINLAIFSAGLGRVVVSAVEHPAVWAALRTLGRFDVDVVPCDPGGRIDPERVMEVVDSGPRPVLVAIMAANNETGIVHPVGPITETLRARGVPTLVDAVQYVGRIPVAFSPDYLIVTGHKLGGPKGAGALVLHPGAKFMPMISGGGQERGRRGGTEPMPAIAGLAAALKVVMSQRPTEPARLLSLRERFEAKVLAALPGARVVGASCERLPNTTSLMLPPGARGSGVVNLLSRANVCISAGSACHAGASEPSQVLTAVGLEPDEAFRVIRVSSGRGTDAARIDRFVELLCKAVGEVRA